MKEILRPDATVLPDSSLVPGNRLVEPTPNQFTHELNGAADYWYFEPDGDTPPAGELPSGTRVVLMRHDGGRTSWVVDGRGLYVAVDFARLRKL
ncbi:MAG TPA: hypothetical protein VFJ16_07530 [Longimicrobium sp.]|nr:hypothetical protein [Longimicrobium sp.]